MCAARCLDLLISAVAMRVLLYMCVRLNMAGQPAAVIQAARQAATEIMAIIDRIPKIDSFSDAGLTPAACRGEIGFQNVVFTYPTAPDHTICKELLLSIPAG